jgi:phosphohistidine phosphatase
MNCLQADFAGAKHVFYVCSRIQLKKQRMKKSEISRILTIVRHGKSSWDYTGIQDADRPLIERGILANHQSAKRFAGKYAAPDLLISSPAARALNTAVIFLTELKLPASNLIIEPSLYLTDVNHVLSLLETLGDSVLSVMLFGHNPCFTDLANHFLKTKTENVPTSGYVRLEFNASSWTDISEENLVTETLDYPNKHND